MTETQLLEVLHEAAVAVRSALDHLPDWGLAGTRPGQYRSDLAADTAALAVLTKAGLGVLSEESGLHDPEREVLVVLDPVDGSTNAARGIPWYATSLCALDPEGPLAAVVVNQASGVRFDALRGGGARRDERAVGPSAATSLDGAVLGVSGYPPMDPGATWLRNFGSAALDLCMVACGVLDGYVDCKVDSHAPWDYLGAVTVCLEAGALVVDAKGRDLVTRGHDERRTPLAAGTPELLVQLQSRWGG